MYVYVPTVYGFLPQINVFIFKTLKKPWILLDLIQNLQILAFYKVVLKTNEFYCGQLRL